MATWQLSRTTRGASSLFIHSFRWGNTSGVAMPPRASAASWRTISDSWSSRKTSKSDGTECGERSCPNTNAISCLCRWHRLSATRREFGYNYLNRALSSENPEASAATAEGVPILRRANIARYLSNKGSFVSSNLERNSEILLSDTSVCLSVPDRSPEVAGAGSMEW